MTPPRLATWLLGASLSERERVYVVGDLEEEFEARARQDLRGARRWYWAQVVRSLPRNLARKRRSRERERGDRASRVGAVLRDAAQALRLFGRHPARSAVLVGTLALGVGTNVALFAVVNGVVLRPLPYPQPDALVRLWDRHEQSGLSYFSVSVPHYLAWRDRVGSLTSVGAYREDGFSFSVGEATRAIPGVRMTSTLFDVLGVRPFLGRTFTADEDRPGAPAVAVVSHAFWRRELGSDPGAIGRPLVINNASSTLVGVMPESFRFPQQPAAEFLLPYRLELDPAGRMAHFLRVLARLSRPDTLDVALEELNGVARQFQADDPGVEAGWTVVGLGLHDEIVGDVGGTLFLLQGAGLLVLMIAAANIANLLLVRASGRSREMAVRAALGAGRSRLVQQLLVESVILAVVGGAAGLLLAALALGVGRGWLPDSLPRGADLAMDMTTVAAAFGLALATGLLFGLVPALTASRRPNLVATIGTSRAVAPGRAGARRVLVTAQLALAVLLLSSAALLVQSTVELARVDPGFEPHRALTFNMGLQGEAFASGAARARLFSRVTDALTSVPGVAAVGVSHRLPLTGNSSFGFRKIGQDGPLDMLQANYRSISGRYFTSMGISLVAGRTFTDAESWEHGGVAIVNQAAVDKFWSGQSPVGQRISVGSGDRPPLEIVGVAADSRESGLTDDVEPAAYLPYVVAPVPAMAIVVRTAVDPGSLLPAVPRAVAGVDRSLAVAGIQTMDVFMASLQTQPRFNSGLASLFALLAVVLASVGVSGVAGWVVAVRSREFGIRLALGALPRQIVRRVVRDALATAALGVAIGVALSLAAGRLLTDLLFGLAPGDPLTLGAVALTLLLVAGVATLVPARRILRLDPAVTLRQ